mgnify:CR=1 FL=1
MFEGGFGKDGESGDAGKPEMLERAEATVLHRSDVRARYSFSGDAMYGHLYTIQKIPRIFRFFFFGDAEESAGVTGLPVSSPLTD